MSDEAPLDVASHSLYLALTALVIVVAIGALGARPLFNPDEGRYAEIAREMLLHGDWVVPHLNGVAYIEKPPLQYWATALSLRWFGQNELAARSYTALCALGTLAMTWLLAHGLWGVAAAWRSAAVLASLGLFVVLGQLLTLDMSLTLYMTASLTGFLLAQRGPGPGPLTTMAGREPRPGRAGAAGSVTDRAAGRWMLMAWFATGLGVMTKGPVAAAIPAGVLIVYSLWMRDGSPWRRLRALPGIALFLIVALPWHWMAARRLTDFLRFYFVHEHLDRYLTPSANHEAPWWYFLGVLVLGSLPWALPAVRVIATGWRPEMRRRLAPRGLVAAGSRFDAGLFLWLWVAFVVVFFSASDSKLIPYVLPALPALAVLIAAAPAVDLARDVRLSAALAVMLALALAAASLYGPGYLEPGDRSRVFAQVAMRLPQIAALLGASGVFVLLHARRDLNRATVLLGVGACLAGILLVRAAALVAPAYSGIVLARALGSVPRDEPIYSVGTYDQTLPFYAQRTVRLVAYRGELDFGLRHDPDAEIPTVEEFVAQWQGIAQGYAVMEMPMLAELKGRGVPMRELARDLRRVLVARR